MTQAGRLAQALEAAPEYDALCFICRHGLALSRYAGRCGACYMRSRRGSVSPPLYHGPCRRTGCPKLGRTKSGYCRRHYEQEWWRARRRERVLQATLGTPLRVREIALGLAESTGRTALARQALLAARAFFERLNAAEVSIQRSPWPKRRLSA